MLKVLKCTCLLLRSRSIDQVDSQNDFDLNQHRCVRVLEFIHLFKVFKARKDFRSVAIINFNPQSLKLGLKQISLTWTNIGFSMDHTSETISISSQLIQPNVESSRAAPPAVN